MFRRSLVLVVALVACGDDNGNRRLADAPPLPDMEILADMPIDEPITPPKDLELGVTASGNGSGRVTSAPAGIDCGSTCTGAFEEGTMVTLTAEPDASSLFTGWGGACSGTTPVCEVTISAATSVTATFTLKTYTVTVTKNGAGSGTVTGNGINCGTGAGCSATVDHGTAISLTATPDNLNVFVGWGDACSGTGTCDLTITGDTTISAGFSLDNLSLIVTRGGNGAGSITSMPAGISCPGTCDFVFTANQMVTLTAMPAASSNFAGWSGACTGMGTCTVTMDAAKAVTGTFTLKRYTLDITKTGSTGTGTVASTPGGIACGGDCNEMYDHGTMVALTATPTLGTSSFGGWGGACSGVAGCSVTMDGPKTVNARFDINTYPLTTSVTGMGTITSMPAGIGCPGDCSQNYNHGTMVTLTPMAATGYTFMGWGGDCSGTGGCSVTMDQAHDVTATFTINRYDLTASVTGMGTITANQISCPSDCTGTFDHGTVVAVTQMAATGYTFTGWGGACMGTGLCNVTMDQMKNVTATFTINRYALSVTFPGANTGTGTVSATGITCPGDCSEMFDHGTVVTVTQVPDGNSNFTGWGGACMGTGACNPTMDMAKTVTASYALKTYTLTASVVGSGTVSAAPSISCPGTCSGTYTHGTMVTVTHSATPGHQFTGWSGACMGTGACVVTMDMARSVTATFTPVYMLSISKGGNGSGTVTSTPAGAINCGSDCSEPILSGGMVTLNAAADMPSSEFAGWSGVPGCTGTGPCTVTVSAATTVTATFNLTKHAVTITALTGNGQVDSSPPGINACTTPGSANCTAMFDYGTIVTLVPKQTGTTAATASVFTGWGGDCSAFGTGNCGLTVTSARNASASFKLAPNIIFTTSRTYTGALPGNGTLDGIQAECEALAKTGGLNGPQPGQNQKWISMLSYRPASFVVFPPIPEVSFATILAQVGNPTGWVRPDGKAVFNTLSDLAANKIYYPPRLDELRRDLGEAPRVWTGTNTNGSYNSRCFNDQGGVVWGGPNGNAVFGLASASSSMLVSFRPGDTQNGMQSCSQQAHLYCLGVDREAVVDEPRTPGRIAFTLNGQWDLTSGLPQADTQCQQEATQAGLTGSFKAFLPGIEPNGYAGCTNANGCPKTAIGRFSLSRGPWVRAGDQVPIVANAADLASDGFKTLVTAPNAFANGSRVDGNVEHWSGSTLPMLGANDNCGNWSNATFLGRAGFVGDTSNTIWWNYNLFNQRCASGDYRKILCFQE